MTDNENSTHFFYSTSCGGCCNEFNSGERQYECHCYRKYCEECVWDYVTLWQKEGDPMFCEECDKYTPYDDKDGVFDPKVVMWLIKSLGLQDKDSKEGSNRYFFTSIKNATKAYENKKPK